MRKLFIFLSFIVFAACSDEQKGSRVTEVTDGDTFNVIMDDEEVTIRLFGIDCPESSQEFGPEATTALQNRISGERVKIDKVTTGTFGRTIAKVHHNGEMINEWLLDQGLAWVFDRFCDQSICDEWKQIEHKKRTNEIGLWSQSNPTAPWEFRD